LNLLLAKATTAEVENAIEAFETGTANLRQRLLARAYFQHQSELDRAHNERVLAGSSDWLATGFRRYYAAQDASRPRGGHAPKPATNGRARGSRRGTHASSSSDDPDPEPEPHRTCECGCGESVDHLKAGARFLNGSHRVRAFRRAQAERDDAVQPTVTVTTQARKPCSDCRHPAASLLPDEDGDPICALCGTLVGRPSPPNGHAVVLGLMVTDADGQFRRKPRKPIARGWRVAPKEPSPVVVIGGWSAP
jgi:hypothetical protein